MTVTTKQTLGTDMDEQVNGVKTNVMGVRGMASWLLYIYVNTHTMHNFTMLLPSLPPLPVRFLHALHCTLWLYTQEEEGVCCTCCPTHTLCGRTFTLAGQSW